ncbi:aminotransferase class V-fold PLP-dependent enzyme [Fluviispira multicolorata]|uniref:cysteine desulfurase n=1 Tax=Fluviispira multicolorata TaxID=2654512 RepID=A0A833N532_9BACT|nr:aminotransferase class V-fold PLP-dependent enzyme [Fluviispira multicolorata]KAB8032093.1 aminotransferase class V-fold PLP-dependent enzyme [Fluviispira multicolorata]
MKATKLGSHIRNEFPIFQNNKKIEDGQTKPFSYLDSAVSAQKHESVIKAMTHHLEYDYGSVHRGAYGVSIRSSQMYENTRIKVANFIGKSVKPEQIVYTRGATESLNILASGIGEEFLNENSRIVIPAAEHHANLIPWQQVALRKNCELAYISFEGKSGDKLKLNLSEAKKLITKNTKVVSLAHVGNVLGQINPIHEIIEIAKKVDALVILDCAQSMTCIDEDLFALGADAIAFSPHKIYGPSGIGVLAMSKELMERLPPFTFGGAMISDVTLEGSQWTSGPAKFEAGTPPITETVGLGAAIDWVAKVGKQNIHDHAAALASEFLNKIQEIQDIEVFSPSTGQETIISFRHKKIHAHDLATILDADNIAMRAGHHCAWPLIRFLGVDALVRCSFAAYSDKDDIEIALAAIKKASNIT